MSIRNLFSWLLIVAASLALGARAFAQGEWAVQKTFHIGGDGGFDYITVDTKSRRLYGASVVLIRSAGKHIGKLVPRHSESWNSKAKAHSLSKHPANVFR